VKWYAVIAYICAILAMSLLVAHLVVQRVFVQGLALGEWGLYGGSVVASIFIVASFLTADKEMVSLGSMIMAMSVLGITLVYCTFFAS